MIGEKGLTRLEQGIGGILIVVLLFALYLNLGMYPLILEEPRRGLIALEMLFSDNFWVPTQTGELYFRKPPVYNWMLILSYKLFGSYSELATRFVSVSSLVAMGFSIYFFVKKHWNVRLAFYSSLGFVLSADILFSFSTLGEIDLFYSLITLWVFFAIYDFGSSGKWYSLFLVSYTLSAVGFLTKGLPSLVFLGLTLLFFFIWKKQFKKLFSVPHLMGLLSFALIVGGYFYQYAQYQDPEGWIATLISESSDRTTSGGFGRFFKHFINWPIDTLKNLLPASILIPFLFIKKWKPLLKENSLLFYGLVVFLLNMLLYWLSPGGRSRYVYPIYPFAVMVILYVFFQLGTEGWKEKYLKIIGIVIIGIGLVGGVAVPLIPTLEIVPNRILLSLFLIFSLSVLMFFFLKQEHLRLLMIMGTFIILRVGFSTIVPVLRAETSNAAKDKALAQTILEETAGAPLAIHGDVRFSFGLVFYIERGREEVLRHTNELTQGGYYFIYPNELAGRSYSILHEMTYTDGNEIWLVKIE